MMISRLFLLGVFVANSMMISATEKVDLQKFLDENLTEDIYDKETLENMRRAVMQYFVHMENVTQGTDFEPPNMKEYWANHPEYVEKYFGNSTILGPDDDEYEDVEPLSLLEVGGSQQGGCEVCIYVIQNKAQHQPFLCRGLRAPSQQQMVRTACLNSYASMHSSPQYISRCVRSPCIRFSYMFPSIHFSLSRKLVRVHPRRHVLVARESSLLDELRMPALVPGFLLGVGQAMSRACSLQLASEFVRSVALLSW